MAPGRARDEVKERQWRRRIDQWRVSGLSVRAFCARHGLATASFYFDAATLRRRLAVLVGGRVMLKIPPAVRIWLAAAPVDLRRSFDGAS